MFRGNNELEINTATLIEAFQFWLEQKVFQQGAAPKVVNITGGSNSYAPTFKVTLAEVEAREARAVA